MKVAFVGKAGCGKTEMSKALMRLYSFKRVSFARPFKIFASQILGRALNKKTDRILLQAIGNTARQVDKEVWLRHMGITLQRLDWVGVENVVVDDCRYLNEAVFLRDNGFILIKLFGRQCKLPEGEAVHVSETELSDITPHYAVDTGGTIANSISQVIRVLEKNYGYGCVRRRTRYKR